LIKLLVVDDSALIRRLLGRLFGAEGDFELAYARDGLEAIAQLHAVRPDVITLDVHMPKLDGLGCLDRIMLEHPCPVVMLSSVTAAGADITLDALQLGAVDFIEKPGGALSLSLDEWGPLLVDKVRGASRVRPRSSLRLTERVRLRVGGAELAVRGAGVASAPMRRAGAAARTAAVPGDIAGAPSRIVLVGTSTGGPPALDALLGPLPADFPWPIVVAQHMPASFTGALARRLDRLCALRVVEAAEPMKLAPGHVYIGRGDADIVVGPAWSEKADALWAMPVESLPQYRWHPSVDRLVDSAMAHVAASRLVGVLMTGMGNDGAAAMTRLRQEGGRTIAEAEETAIVWGMPGELVRAGGAEATRRLEAIAGTLLEWAA
jgi:two-component system chemotaxis response regulator CheB